jgi:HD-GYP domain-containing protein (c-di-GMP phosphodiesterase class II)
MQIVDIYDALTSSRAYKTAFTPKAAVRMLEEETARGWRDPVLVDNFLRIHNDVIVKVIDSSRRSDRSLNALGKSLLNVDQMMKPLSNLVRARMSLSPAL